MNARRLSIAAIVFGCATPFSATSSAGNSVSNAISPSPGEEYEHLIGTIPAVCTAWADITFEHWLPPWQYNLNIDMSGHVSSAVFVLGPNAQRDDAGRITANLQAGVR
jgi:hypothetical protein